jgi:hypothetical protein
LRRRRVCSSGTPSISFADVTGAPMNLTVTSATGPSAPVVNANGVIVDSSRSARVTLLYSDVPSGGATSCPQVGSITLAFSGQNLIVTPSIFEPCGGRVAVSGYY